MALEQQQISLHVAMWKMAQAWVPSLEEILYTQGWHKTLVSITKARLSRSLVTT